MGVGGHIRVKRCSFKRKSDRGHGTSEHYLVDGDYMNTLHTIAKSEEHEEHNTGETYPEDGDDVGSS